MQLYRALWLVEAEVKNGSPGWILFVVAQERFRSALYCGSTKASFLIVANSMSSLPFAPLFTVSKTMCILVYCTKAVYSLIVRSQAKKFQLF